MWDRAAVGDLVWAEEFDGAAGSPPASATWTAQIGAGGWGCDQRQWYTDSPANASITAEGHLAIVARRHKVSDEPDSIPQGSITSARLITQHKVNLAHGRIAARIQVPAGIGTWPAFWMLGSNLDQVGWPACGEIDVMEHVGSEPTTVHGTVHAPGYSGLNGGIGKAYDTGTDLASAFHVYAVDWAPQQITWLLDDTAYQHLTAADVPGPWPFTHPFFLVINLAIGGAWPGNDTDQPSLPAHMLIDWIRVYADR